MNIKKFLMKELKYYGFVGFELERFISWLYVSYTNRGSIEECIRRKYHSVHKQELDLKDPKTLNEKIQWLKLYGFEDFHTKCADKYRMREFLKEVLGTEDYQIPVLYKTVNWKDINLSVIPDEPCVIKANHTQGDVLIVRDKNQLDIKRLRTDCHWWMNRNIYKTSQEPQYKNIQPMIIIEKLLLTKEGKIPNDYKLHYINGELQFVYCAVDREGINKRNIYDADWKPVMFTWSEPEKDATTLRGPEIAAPKSFDKMKELASQIAKYFKYVRVDFYDVDGDLYFGEITLHHGSGLDVFNPIDMDLYYGQKLKLG